MYVYLIVIVLIGLLLGLGLKNDMKESGRSVRDYKDVMEIFQIAASYAYEKLRSLIPSWYMVEDFLDRDDVGRDLTLLHPEEKRKKLFTKHLQNKIALSIMLLLCVNLLGLLVCVTSQGGQIQNGKQINREEYGDGQRDIVLEVEGDGHRQEVEIQVSNRHYTGDEVPELLEKAKEEAKASLLGENEDLEHVTGDLNPVASVMSDLVSVKWFFSDYDVVDGNGKLHEDVLDEKLAALEVTDIANEAVYPLEVKAVLEYDNQKSEFEELLYIRARELTSEEAWAKAVRKAAKEEDKSSIGEAFYKLPEEVNGSTLRWTEKRENYVGVFLILGLIAVAGIFVGQDLELQKEVKIRRQEMEVDYPEFVSKLTLMVAAGLSISGAWERMVRSYLESRKRGGRKRFVYEEMLLTQREIESGKLERQAFENFGDRCQVPCYKKFSNLVLQNMKKGSAGFKESLEYEVAVAFEYRKHIAKIKGEEASTKLLLPMGIMLGIVLIIIVMPAFMSIKL